MPRSDAQWGACAALRPLGQVAAATLLGIGTLAGCGEPSSDASTGATPQPASLPPSEGTGFVEVAEAAGLSASNRLPSDRLTNVVDSLGGGAAFSDLDDDGWPDLVVLGGALSPDSSPEGRENGGVHLYRNRGNGVFVEMGGRSGIPTDSTAVAVAVGDVDGDGDRDLFLTDRGPNHLYLNRGDGTFVERSEEAHLGDPRFGAACVFFDMDSDGDLDLYVGNYLNFDPGENAFYAPTGFPGPLAYEAESDILYRNDGTGRFEDVSEESGIAALQGRAMSVAASDFDEDGDVDLFVANDATENFLLLNDGSGGFTEAGSKAGLAFGDMGERTSAMAAEVGDVDGDGFLDVTVSDTAYGALYIRQAPGRYRDFSMQAGVARACGRFVSWGQNLFDVDADGDLDLFVVNGGLHHLVGWQDQLLLNDGSGKFEERSDDYGAHFREAEVGRASITADYDNDGDLDVLVTRLAGSVRLLRNDTPGDFGWITLDLVGARSRDPLGARVEVESGGSRQFAVLRCRTAYLGQSDSRLYFGLGEGVGEVDRITITWPEGEVQTLEDVPARRVLRIQRSRP